MLNKVTSVEVVGPASLAVVFADGAQGVHDFSHLLMHDGPVVVPLKNPEFFSRVFLEFGALTWPNGFDLCPDALRLEMEGAGEIQHIAAAE